MNKQTTTSSATPKQEKPVKKQPKPRKRLGPVLTVFLIFLALLAVAAAVLVVNAWRELNHVTEETQQASNTTTVEVWTPVGAANNPAQAMIPPPVPDATQASAPLAAGSVNTAAQTTGTDTPAAATPLQPVTSQPHAAPATPAQERKPAAGHKNTLDNLF